MSDLAARLARVKILLCDVDGVLTDGAVWMGGDVEMKRFDIRDGLGIVLLRRCGLKVGWISARPSPATRARAEDLKIDFLHQDKGPKTGAVENILAQTGLGWADVCFIGDDVVDLGALRRAGLAVAPADGITEAKALAHHVTQARGGHGAVREIVEMILKAQGHWDTLVAGYSA